MADALFSASFLNACLRHCDDAAMANVAPLVNTRGPLYVHPGGIVKRTSFHMLAMYANLLEARVAPLSLEPGLICQWIAFNALYGQWDKRRGEPLYDRECWRLFFERILELDADGVLGDPNPSLPLWLLQLHPLSAHFFAGGKTWSPVFSASDDGTWT
jgi:hypothetical protein